MKFMLGEGYTKFYADAELRLFVNPLQSYYKYSKERDYKLACRICEDMLYSELKKYINGINPLSRKSSYIRSSFAWSVYSAAGSKRRKREYLVLCNIHKK